jgi:hypothetical protein
MGNPSHTVRLPHGSFTAAQPPVTAARLVRACGALACVALFPALAHAQATLSGVVRDASGAVLPGVTVEASSPALIEKVRTTVTDDTGQYRLTELRPGVYQLTFTLSGFNTVRRPDVAVSGAAVITISVDMTVGAQETITVTGETPVVDTQSTLRQSVLDNEVIQALPAARGYGALLNAVPALQGGYQDSQITPVMTFFNTYGGRPNEGRVQLDGINVGSSFNGGGVSGFAYDTATAAEVQVTLSGGLGEAEVSSANVNIIPRTGGNDFSGSAFFSTAGEWSQGTNLDDELEGFGITEPADLVKAWDLNGAFGGPIKRDRLWFFGNVRNFGQHIEVPGLNANANAGTTSFVYSPDPAVSVRNPTAQQIYAVRLTGQATERDKLGFYIDQQYVCTGSALTTGADSCRPRGDDWVGNGAIGGFAPASPESTTTYVDNARQRIVQATWTRPQTNRLLIEAGYSTYLSRWGWMETPGSRTDLTPITQQSARACTPATPCPDGRTSGTLVPVPNFTYRGLDNFFDNKQNPHNWRATASYVTGAHNIKVGYQGNHYIEETHDFANDTQLTYTINDGSITPANPNGTVSVGYRIAPWQTSSRTQSHAFFVQDQWTMDRVTVQGAIRYDRARSWFPSEHNGAPLPSRFNAEPISFPRTDGVQGWNDITTRWGAAWDVFGNGRTAVKGNIGKYLQAAVNQTQYSINNPALDGRNGRGGPRFQSSTSRSWTDSNGNWLVDCDLTNQLAQNNTATGGDVCAQSFNLNFGDLNNPLTVDPEVLASGWGKRPYDWHLGLSVQQELVPRVSIELGYNRRWYGNFFVTDNLATAAGDYDFFTITAPTHPELPDGGGYEVTYFNVNGPAFARPPQNFYTFADTYGDWTQYWHGFDVIGTARLRNGLTLQGGTNTGRGIRDNCDVANLVPETQLAVTLGPFSTIQPAASCDIAEPWITTVRGLATYTVPKIDVLVSAIVRFQTTATGFFTGGDAAPGSNGTSLTANYNLRNSCDPPAPACAPGTPNVLDSLGRLPSGGQATGTYAVNLLSNGQLYPEQLRTMDMRFAKVLRFAGTRTDVGIDLYNVFNANTGTAFNGAFGTDGATWLRPTAIQNARFLRFNLTVNF